MNLIKKSLTTRFGQNFEVDPDFLRRPPGAFDIAELRDLMAEDELELDTLGDRKSALFVILSDTDSTFNFVAALMYPAFQPPVRQGG